MAETPSPTLVIYDTAAFWRTVEFAKSAGGLDGFLEAVKRLCRPASNGCATRIELFADRHVAHSFDWVEYRQPTPSSAFTRGMIGGLIYHGPGQPGDGSAPAFSVSLDPDADGTKHVWSIHT